MFSWIVDSETNMLIVLLGLLLRLSIALHSYSGENKPPMYGDYEAQRHWMEITYNLPIHEWYFNTTDNDLMYWGLDYPPLTAYHSWLCGYFACSLNNSYIKLNSSKGFESSSHKYFMRITVLIADLLAFIPSVVLYFLWNKRDDICKVKDYLVSTNETMKISCLLALMYPGIILIDHGHFQYNCVSLGLFVYSVTAVCQRRHLIASVLFCCAITYKQMELYHALPFFFYFLGDIYFIFKNQGNLKAINSFICLGSTVLLTLSCICLPFMTNLNQGTQLLTRLFPIARGVFEDKVANIWCVVNIVYKLKIISNVNMAKVCLVSTCLATLPSLYDVFISHSLLKFKYCLVNSALSFFLLSYQVHEKSILLVAIPVLLIMPNDPFASVWFLIISVFSMLPLLVKDQLTFPALLLSVLFITIFSTSSFYKKNENAKFMKIFHFNVITRHLHLLYHLSLFGCCFFTLGICWIKPPIKYPDLFPLLISVYSCLHFIAFLVYFNIRQRSSEETKKVHGCE